MKIILNFLLLMGMLLGIPSLYAQSQTLTLDQAIEWAMGNNLAIKAQNYNKEAAKQMEQSAFELPKTNASFQYGNNEGFEKNDGISISQSIPFPTLFGAKRKLFEAQTQDREWDKLTTINELKSQIRTYYYQLQYLENNAEKLKYLENLYADFVKIASLRYKTGDTKKIDISSAETQRGEIILLSQQNQVFLDNGYKSLKTLLQYNNDFRVTTETYAPMLLTTIVDSSAVANHPKILALYQKAKIAEQSQKVERAQVLPDFTLGYTNASLIGMHTKNNVEAFYGRSQRFSSVDVGITIPITFGATKARIRALEAEKQAAAYNAQMQAQLLMNELQNDLLQYEQYVKQYNYYHQQALPNADEMIKTAQLGYKTGDLSYVEYLYALNTATNVQLKYLQSIQQINQSVIDIYSLINK